jgi:peptidoglycan-associated lipoprotein
MLKTLIVLSIALTACAADKPPPRTGLQARADTGTSTDATTAKNTETPQQASNSGTVQISDEIRAACGIDRGDAFFAFDSTRLQSKDIPTLNKVVTCFSTGPLKNRGMRLVGHADPRGPSDYNMVLGQNRADAVAGYMRGKGLAKSQTETTSRGAMDANGSDESGYARDRRVDVLLSQ